MKKKKLYTWSITTKRKGKWKWTPKCSNHMCGALWRRVNTCVEPGKRLNVYLYTYIRYIESFLARAGIWAQQIHQSVLSSVYLDTCVWLHMCSCSVHRSPKTQSKGKSVWFWTDEHIPACGKFMCAHKLSSKRGDNEPIRICVACVCLYCVGSNDRMYKSPNGISLV